MKDDNDPSLTLRDIENAVSLVPKQSTRADVAHFHIRATHILLSFYTTFTSSTRI